MLNGDNSETRASLNILNDVVAHGERPLVYWLGAGVGKWIGYPLWSEFADSLHSHFLRQEEDYDPLEANALLARGNYPAFFGLCESVNQRAYRRALADAFDGRPTTPVFDRLCRALGELRPLYILTTNVDPSLQTSLPDFPPKKWTPS